MHIFVHYLEQIMYKILLQLTHILVHTSRVNLEEQSTKVETVRYSLGNLVGQDSTESVYSTITSLLQSTVHSKTVTISNQSY